MRAMTVAGVRRRRRILPAALCAAFLLGLPALSQAAEAEGEAAAPVHDMSAILGPGSQLQAAPDGEFNFTFGDEGFDTFRAVKDVIVTTEDIDCQCDELDYRRAEGTLTATTRAPRRVRIKLRNVNTGMPGSSKKGDTYATCRRYRMFIAEQRHELTLDPVIIRTDENGKQTAIAGDVIILTQDKNGRWNMNVKGNPRIYDPNEKNKLDKVREKLSGTKPTINLDADPLGEASEPAPPPSEAADTAPAPSKSLKIDEGNVEKLKPRKPSRVIKLEEGG